MPPDAACSCSIQSASAFTNSRWLINFHRFAAYRRAVTARNNRTRHAARLTGISKIQRTSALCSSVVVYELHIVRVLQIF